MENQKEIGRGEKESYSNGSIPDESFASVEPQGRLVTICRYDTLSIFC